MLKYLFKYYFIMGDTEDSATTIDPSSNKCGEIEEKLTKTKLSATVERAPVPEGELIKLSDDEHDNEAGENKATPVPSKEQANQGKADGSQQTNELAECDMCKSLLAEVYKLKNELEREVQRRFDLEQRFTEEAKRSTDQIEELIAKSDQDDSKFKELKKNFELYVRETSSMIENFTTNREVLTSQLMGLRQENDYLLGKYVGKSRDLQNEDINLPQTVEDLQFHCLTLNEKLILSTLAKEQLEETLVRNTSG